MNELKQIEKQLHKAQKASTCDSVCIALFFGKSCREELNNYTPRNQEEEIKKNQLLALCENMIEWANYWGERIA